MSNLENTFKMLFKLKSGKVLKKKELAEEFNVTERQIGRYKNILDDFFTIESIPGPNGGYKLLDAYFPFKQLLTKEEIMLLKFSMNSLDDSSNKKIKNALDKINYSILNGEENMTTQIIPYSRINMQNVKLDNMKFEIYEAILNKKEIIIEYIGNNGHESRRRVQPYRLYFFKGELYLVAYCLEKMDIRFFKLARIERYIITSKLFEKNLNIEYKINEDRKNSIGIFSGEVYKLELAISPPMANTIKERIWVDNQEIETLSDGTIIFKANMRGGPEIISWILSMNSCVKSIKPEALKNKVKEELEKMMKNFV